VNATREPEGAGRGLKVNLPDTISNSPFSSCWRNR
jgi:hypothetical protein